MNPVLYSGKILTKVILLPMRKVTVFAPFTFLAVVDFTWVKLERCIHHLIITPCATVQLQNPYLQKDALEREALVVNKLSGIIHHRHFFGFVLIFYMHVYVHASSVLIFLCPFRSQLS